MALPRKRALSACHCNAPRAAASRNGAMRTILTALSRGSDPIKGPGERGKRGMALGRMVKAVECCLDVLGKTARKKR